MESEDLRIISEGIDVAIENVVKAVTLGITDELIETTPVDVGWARANWVPSIGAPAPGSPIARSTQEREAAAPGAQASQAAGIASVAGYKLNRGAVFISNNVPYLKELNEGSSQQAPANFIEASIDRGVAGIGRRRR